MKEKPAAQEGTGEIMTSKDPKTGFVFKINLNPQIMEWIQDELADVPETELDRLKILRAAVKVHAEQMCAIGDTAPDRAYAELVVNHFVGTRVCAWCGEVLGQLAPGNTGISHGICKPCTDKLESPWQEPQ